MAFVQLQVYDRLVVGKEPYRMWLEVYTVSNSGKSGTAVIDNDMHPAHKDLPRTEHRWWWSSGRCLICGEPATVVTNEELAILNLVDLLSSR